MANRSFYEFHLSLEPKVVSLFLQIDVGASGAVSAFKGGGIASVEKETEDGQYTITLQDEYYRLLGVQGIVVHDAASAVAAMQVLADPADIQADFLANKGFILQLVDGAGAEVDAEDGSQLLIEIKCRNSTLDTYYV